MDTTDKVRAAWSGAVGWVSRALWAGLVGMCWCGSTWGAVSFHSFGVGSYAGGISADGTVVVGSSPAVAGEGFRWTEAGGMQDLGSLPTGYSRASAYRASHDGSIIAGTLYASGGYQAFRWTAASGIVPLGDLGGNHSVVEGISDDGAVIVGSDLSITAVDQEGFRWTQATGMVALGYLTGPPSVADGISGDGRIIVGFSDPNPSSQTVVWTEGAGVASIGVGGSAWDASFDGSAIVGYLNLGGSPIAYRWTQATGRVSLGDFPGGLYLSYAHAVSYDGRVVVGRSSSDIGTEAFVWTADSGMRRVQEILAENGVDLPGWRLRLASDVSADGTVIVGYGVNPAGQDEGWAAVIPEPGSVWVAVIGGLGLARRRRG